ncbi:hypothetical protein, partial [Escherichia coli]|uniref:hypothetical protein n=1 Tax=Escherichia coli TaxID=562 RepID=UPI00200CD79E
YIICFYVWRRIIMAIQEKLSIFGYTNREQRRLMKKQENISPNSDTPSISDQTNCGTGPSLAMMVPNP